MHMVIQSDVTFPPPIQLLPESGTINTFMEKRLYS